jgi:hypothetical protein
MHRNTSDFVLMKDPSDTQEYEMVVLNCYLYVKVAKLSDTIYKEFYSRFLSGKETLKYQFRKLNVKEFKIPSAGQEFVSGELFPDSEVPSKLFFVLVFTDSKQGKQTTNPFHFWRKFTSTVNLNTIENHQGAIQASYMKEKMDLELARMEQKMRQQLAEEMRLQFESLGATLGETLAARLTGNVASGLGSISGTNQDNSGQVPPCLTPNLPSRTRATRSTNAQSTSQQAVNRNSEDDDLNSERSFASAASGQAAAGHLARPPLPQVSTQPQQEFSLTVDLPVYVQTLEVLLNSAQVDQVKLNSNCYI